MNTKMLRTIPALALGLFPLGLPTHADNIMNGMDMKTSMADMQTAVVPQLQEIGTYTATGDEDWKQQTGFGHNAPMVEMMNQMMVGGSGMEGMKMSPMKMDFGSQNYAKPAADDGGAGSMAGMNMGQAAKPDAQAPPKPTAPAPEAPTAEAPKQDQSMTGMGMSARKPQPIASAPMGALKITAATPSSAKAGDNTLNIAVMDAGGKPVTGATISTSVAMTSMDMGTTHPAVTEKGGGQYTAVVNFSMAGPWRVKVTVTPPGQKPQIKTLDFTAH